MDSKIIVVEKLIEEGESYTFDNFCLPYSGMGSNNGKYGGHDTVEWKTFKIRAVNMVSELQSSKSPAMDLVTKAVEAQTSGFEQKQFESVKEDLIFGLKLLHNALKEDVFGELSETKSQSSSPANSNKIFIVHGHDQTLKIDLERFVREIGLIPVVLHREADEGATIIEKFEKHSDVGFAFIILTPDEMSYTVDQSELPEKNRKIELRARPNVIFEFGYFVGKLGRNRVCCLHKGNVELPSDIDGLVYKKVEDTVDAQAYSIILELKAAGYEISV